VGWGVKTWEEKGLGHVELARLSQTGNRPVKHDRNQYWYPNQLGVCTLWRCLKCWEKKNYESSAKNTYVATRGTSGEFAKAG